MLFKKKFLYNNNIIETILLGFQCIMLIRKLIAMIEENTNKIITPDAVTKLESRTVSEFGIETVIITIILETLMTSLICYSN